MIVYVIDSTEDRARKRFRHGDYFNTIENAKEQLKGYGKNDGWKIYALTISITVKECKE